MSGTYPSPTLRSPILNGGTLSSVGESISGSWAGTPTWTGVHTFSAAVTHSSTTALQGAATVGTNTAAATLAINGQTGSTRTLQYNNTGVSRWRWQCDGANSSGNAGDTLRLFGFDDTGASLGEVMRFTRATGSITWNNGLSYPDPIYSAHGGSITADKTFGQSGTHTYTTGVAPGTGGLSPMGINQNCTFTGTLDTGVGAPNFNNIVTNDTVNAARALPQTAQLGMTHTYNTGASGDRVQLALVYNKLAASVDGLFTSNIGLEVFMHADAGESTNPANPLSRATAVNFDCRIGGTGTAYSVLLCQENDLRLYASNTVQSKGNLSIHWGVFDAGHGSVEDYGIAFSSSPAIAPATGGGNVLLQIGNWGQGLPWDPTVSGTAIMSVQANLLANLPFGWNPTVTFGFDLTGLKFTTAAFRSRGITVDGVGQLPILGPAAITYSSSGVKIAVPNVICTAVAIAAAGTGYRANDYVVDSMGNLVQITAVTSTTPTAVALVQTNYAAVAPTNPVTTNFGCGTGLTLNLTTAATGSLNLGDTGQKLGFLGATAIVRPTVTGSRGANAALASVLTALANLGLIVDSST